MRDDFILDIPHRSLPMANYKLEVKVTSTNLDDNSVAETTQSFSLLNYQAHFGTRNAITDAISEALKGLGEQKMAGAK